MFRVVSPPIITSTVTATCHYRERVGTLWVPTLPRQRQVAVTVWQIPDAVDTFVCAPDDGWRHHPIHVEQFADINILCKVASCWRYILEYRNIPFLLLPTWYTDSLFIHTNYMKLNSSTCFERNPLIIRRSTTQIVHMQPLVSSLCKSELSKLLC